MNESGQLLLPTMFTYLVKNVNRKNQKKERGKKKKESRDH